MENWDKYYEENDEPILNYENQLIQDIKNNNEETTSPEGYIYLSDEQLNEFINRVSGKDTEGRAKSKISYQAFDMDSNDSEKDMIYQVNQGEIRIYRNKIYDSMYLVDIIFKSCEDTELKLLWGRIQRHLKHQMEESNKNWIFYINLLEVASVTEQTEENDTLLTVNIFNPILCYLTREVPNLRIEESNINNELQGGNIIRMIVPSELLTFNIINDIDTNELKSEVQLEEENSRYINNQ